MQGTSMVTAVCTCVVALAVSSSAREGKVLHVPGAYPTIQAAVDAADPGDRVRVAAGVYNENVVVTTPGLRLEASEGTVIDGTGLFGPGVRIAGTPTASIVGVRVSGFEIRNFEHGVVAIRAEGVWIHRNDIHDNVDKVAPFVWTDAFGVDLQSVRSSTVSGNIVHHNGGNGIAVRVGSARNTIRANRIRDNAWQSPDGSGVGLQVTGPSNDNELLENLVVANNGWGIQVGRPAGLALSGTFIAQNRSHMNLRAGIALMGSAVSDNSVHQNNATGNQVGGIATSPCWPFDLFSEAATNSFARNQGTASPGLD